jgi:hypothetical protein
VDWANFYASEPASPGSNRLATSIIQAYKNNLAGVTDAEISLLEQSGLGIPIGQQYRNAKIPINAETIIREFRDTNRDGDARKLGSGAFNSVYEVTYNTASGPKVRVFKPEGLLSLGTAAQNSGIPNQYPNFGSRNIAAYKLNRLLNFDVVPEVEFATAAIPDNSGNPTLKFGIAMSKAPGRSPLFSEDRTVNGRTVAVEKAVEFDYGQAALQRELIKLQLLDALCAQADRHAGNYFISQTSTRTQVTGIDNDQSFGGDIQHPNELMQGNKRGFRGVGLPGVVDVDMVKAFFSKSHQDVADALEGLLAPHEILATAQRFIAIQDHLRVLINDKRVISPQMWGTLEVNDVLVASQYGKNYIQREYSAVETLRNKGETVANTQVNGPNAYALSSAYSGSYGQLVLAPPVNNPSGGNPVLPPPVNP